MRGSASTAGHFGDSETISIQPALAAVEQRTVPGFEGTEKELQILLLEGLASGELAEDEFWDSVSRQTDALLVEHKAGRHS